LCHPRLYGNKKHCANSKSQPPCAFDALHLNLAACSVTQSCSFMLSNYALRISTKRWKLSFRVVACIAMANWKRLSGVNYSFRQQFVAHQVTDGKQPS
jgi:hypothetical protein